MRITPHIEILYLDVHNIHQPGPTIAGTRHLERAGFGWLAPWLRGCGPTRFLSIETIRDGSAVALAQDAIDVADHLGWTRFSVVGHDWGAHCLHAGGAFSRASLIYFLCAARPLRNPNIRAITTLVYQSAREAPNEVGVDVLSQLKDFCVIGAFDRSAAAVVTQAT